MNQEILHLLPATKFKHVIFLRYELLFPTRVKPGYQIHTDHELKKKKTCKTNSLSVYFDQLLIRNPGQHSLQFSETTLS